jgi:hypothetical protein
MSQYYYLSEDILKKQCENKGRFIFFITAAFIGATNRSFEVN